MAKAEICNRKFTFIGPHLSRQWLKTCQFCFYSTIHITIHVFFRIAHVIILTLEWKEGRAKYIRTNLLLLKVRNFVWHVELTASSCLDWVSSPSSTGNVLTHALWTWTWDIPSLENRHELQKDRKSRKQLNGKTTESKEPKKLITSFFLRNLRK